MILFHFFPSDVSFIIFKHVFLAVNIAFNCLQVPHHCGAQVQGFLNLHPTWNSKRV